MFWKVQITIGNFESKRYKKDGPIWHKKIIKISQKSQESNVCAAFCSILVPIDPLCKLTINLNRHISLLICWTFGFNETIFRFVFTCPNFTIWTLKKFMKLRNEKKNFILKLKIETMQKDRLGTNKVLILFIVS